MTRWFGRCLVLVSVAAVGITILWAALSKIDSVTRGEAQVVPSSQKQVVQNQEGGILAELLVKEGQEVEAGQPLMIIANSVTDAELGDLQSKDRTLRARVARLMAEANGASSPEEIVFPQDLIETAPAVIEFEKAQFATRFQELQSQLGVLTEQRQQREQEIAVIQGRLARLNEALALAEKEHRIMQPMLASGAVSKIDMLTRERQIISLNTDITEAKLTIPQNQAAVEEANKKIEAQTETYRARALEELSQNQLELASVLQRLVAGQDRKLRTEVVSPVKGRINDIKVRTINGVIGPGQDLVEIIPADDTLLIEARVSPKDIGSIHLGQKSKIKISAYDYSIYGGLEGTVEKISPDAIVNAKGESFYRVYVRTKHSYIGSETHRLPIIAGMTGTVEVLGSERTVLDKITAPLREALAVALRER